MRHLFLTVEYPPDRGGIATYIENEIKEFRRAGEEVWVAALPLGEDDKETAENLADKQLRRVPFFFRFIFPRWLRLAWYLYRDLRPDSYDYILVHHVLPMGQVAWLIGKLKKIKYVVHVHGLDVSLARKGRIKRWWLRRVLAGADFIVANSNFARKQLEGFPVRRAVVAYPCPNTNIIGVQVSKDTLNNLRNRYVLGSRKVLLSVARLVKRKGLQSVAEILPDILKVDPNIVWCIIGLGDYADELGKIINKYDLQHATRFIGRVDDTDLAAWYTLCDLFVMPSIQIGADVEGWGIVYLEAGLFGKAVVSGKAGGCPEAVLDGKTGVLVDGEKPEEVRDAVLKLMKDEALRQQLGEAAKQRVLKEFTWEAQAKKVLEALKK
ncbi:MAG: glycosyltransferase family 4 protein [Candidatus Magasanikbacteria bacterium]|nr:glycosyltransferase family 4 protein [Candidatus Magasanikbacteria bacterium]